MQLYPDEPSVGSPYGTENQTFPALGLQFKRIASMLGDYLLIAANRFNAQTSVKHGRDTWAYRFDLKSAAVSNVYGVPHATDIPFVFYIPTPGLSEAQNATSRFMARSWIAFVNDLDPTDTGLEGFPAWPKYNRDAKNLVFKEQSYIEQDDFRKEGIQFINEHLLEFVA